MLGCLFRWWTRNLRAAAPEMFDGELATQAVREAIAEHA